MNIKIEKGITMPTRRRGRGLRATMIEMEVGDSFVYPRSRTNSVTGTACMIRKEQPKYRIATRTIDEDTIRVWRTA